MGSIVISIIFPYIFYIRDQELTPGLKNKMYGKIMGDFKMSYLMTSRMHAMALNRNLKRLPGLFCVTWPGSFSVPAHAFWFNLCASNFSKVDELGIGECKSVFVYVDTR